MLSRAGWGGVMLALVEPHTQERVAAAVRAAGATRIYSNVVRAIPVEAES
jgi:galactokinase